MKKKGVKDILDVDEDLLVVGMVVNEQKSNIISDFFAEEAKKACKSRADELEIGFKEIEKKIREISNAERREVLLAKFKTYKHAKEIETNSTAGYSGIITSFAESINGLFGVFGIEIDNIYNFYNVLTPNQYGYLINMFDKSLESEKRRFIGIALHKIVDNGLDLYKSNMPSLFEEFVNYNSQKEKLRQSGIINNIKLEEITSECVEKNLSELEKKANSKDIDVIIKVLKEKYSGLSEAKFEAAQCKEARPDEVFGFDDLNEDIKGLITELSKTENVSGSQNSSSLYSHPKVENLLKKLSAIKDEKRLEENQETINLLVDYLIKHKKITMISPNFMPVAVGEGYDYKRQPGSQGGENELKNTFNSFYEEIRKKFPQCSSNQSAKESQNDKLLIEDALNTLFLLENSEMDLLSDELYEIKSKNNIKNKFLAVTLNDQHGHEYLLSIFSKLEEKGSFDASDVCGKCKEKMCIDKSLCNGYNKEGLDEICNKCSKTACMDKSTCTDYIDAGSSVYKKNKYDIVKMMVELKDMDSFNIKTMFSLLFHMADTSNVILSDFGMSYNINPKFRGLSRIDALKEYLRSRHWNIK